MEKTFDFEIILSIQKVAKIEQGGPLYPYVVWLHFRYLQCNVTTSKLTSVQRMCLVPCRFITCGSVELPLQSKHRTVPSQESPPHHPQPPVTTKLSVQFSSVAQSCPTLCDPMNCSMPGLPVHHQLPELTQTHVHRVSE